MTALQHCDAGGSGPSDKRRVASLTRQGLANPPACLEACTATVMRRLLSSRSSLPRYCGNMTGDICATMQTAIPKRELWELYWCDSTYCGVNIDRSKGLSQDPMVNKVINRCQDIGFHGVFDPGPPSAGYTCPFYVDFDAASGDDEGCSGRTGALSTPPAESLPSESTLSAAAPPSASAVSHAATPAAPTHNRVSIAPESSSAAVDAAAEAGVRAATSSGDSVSPELSTGARAAIAVCSAVAIVILVGLVFVLIRARRRRRADARDSRESFEGGLRDAHLRRNRYADGSIGAESGTHRLVSHASNSTVGSDNSTGGGGQASAGVGGGVLDKDATTAARLWESARIPAIFTRRSESPPLTPLGPASESGLALPTSRDRCESQPWREGCGVAGSFTFPTSPLCTPTINKLVPRHERSGSRKLQGLPIGQDENDITMAHVEAKAEHSSCASSMMDVPSPPQNPPAVAEHGRAGQQRSSAHNSSRGGSVGSVSGGGTPTAASSLRNEFVIGNGDTSRPTTPGTPRHAPPLIPPPTAQLPPLPVPSPPASPPSSPTRPPRPHEAPLEIPGLLTAMASPTSAAVAPGPRSPPPVSYHRVLPPLPTATSARSWRKGSSSSSLSSLVAAARAPPPSTDGPVRQQPATKPGMPGKGHRVTDSAPPLLALRGFRGEERTVATAAADLTGEARDFCELTEEYAREAAKEQGDRPMVGGAALPATRKGRKRGDSCANNRREELDLERLGGRYQGT